MPPLFKRPIPGQPITVNLNSVRHPVPYQGSTNPDDLMDLYVGNTHYRKINRYMREGDHQSGVNEILDEMIVRDDRRPPSYEEALQSGTLVQESAKNYLQGNGYSGDIGNYLAEQNHPGFTLGEKQYKWGELWQQANTPEVQAAIEPHIAKLANATPKEIETMARRQSSYLPMRQEAEQVVASIPHVNTELLQRDRIAPKKGIEEYRDVAEYFVKDPTGDYLWDAAEQSPLMIKGKAVDPDQFSAVSADFEGHLNEHLKKTTGGTLFDGNYEVNPAGIAAANDFLSGKLQIGDTQPGNLYRGLHFKNPNEYDAFVNQHQPGKVVEYPAFTSTTSDTKIQEGFAGKRHGEHPVLMEIEAPSQGRWVDNKAESEYLYPASSRFEIVRTEPIENGQMGGTKIIARETTAQTPVEARTSGLLGRLKNRAFVPEPQSMAAEDLLNAHLTRPSRLGQTRSAYKDRMTTTPSAVPTMMGYDSSDRMMMI